MQSFSLCFANPHPECHTILYFSSLGLSYPPRNKITVIPSKQEAESRAHFPGIKGTTHTSRQRAQELLWRIYLYPFGIS